MTPNRVECKGAASNNVLVLLHDEIHISFSFGQDVSMRPAICYPVTAGEKNTAVHGTWYISHTSARVACIALENELSNSQLHIWTCANETLFERRTIHTSQIQDQHSHSNHVWITVFAD